MARLPFLLGGNEIHDENPAERLRREAEERRARALLSQAAAMGRVTPAAEPSAAPSAPPPPAPVTSASAATRVSAAGSAPRSSSRVAIPSARARLLEVMASESPRVAAYLRESMGPELEAAQQEAGQRRLGVNLGRAGAMLNEAISGARYDRGAYDALAEEADRPVTDLGARESLSRQDWQDTGSAQDRQARLQGYEDERADRTTERNLELARDARTQEQRVEDANRSDAVREQGRQDNLNQDAESRRRWEAEMELRRREAEAKAARTGGGGVSGLPPEERLAKATASAKVSPIVSSLERIEQLLPGSTTGGTGAGGVDGWSRAVSNLPGGWGTWLATDKGLAITREVQNLRDVVRRARSGAAITAAEEADYLRLLDDAALADPRALSTGLDIVRREVGQKLADINAGFDPAVVQRYQERGGTTANSPVVAGGQRPPDINLSAPSPTGRRVTMPDGTVWEELSDGSSRQVR